MATKIFINLPVKDLNKSIEFFTHLGFRFNPQFTDEKATCMIIGEDIFVMLLVEEYFQTFTGKKISDARNSSEVILCLSAESRSAVNDLVRKALEAGGSTLNEAQDQGWMYSHGFEDIDGHIWEVVYLDVHAFKQEGGEQVVAETSI